MADYRRYSDEELFAKVGENDKYAFEQLYDRYWRKAYVIAFSKVQDREVAEEIVQDLFILLWNKRDTISIQNFRSYVYTAIKNKCLNHIESKIVEQKHWLYYHAFFRKRVDRPDHVLDYNELMDAIEAGIGELPQKTQKVFRLSRFEGRSIPEIARDLDLSEKAIEYHLSRGLKELRMRLKDSDLLLSIVLTCLLRP